MITIMIDIDKDDRSAVLSHVDDIIAAGLVDSTDGNKDDFVVDTIIIQPYGHDEFEYDIKTTHFGTRETVSRETLGLTK